MIISEGHRNLLHMDGQMKFVLAVATVLSVAAAAYLWAPFGRLPETKDRLTPEAMERLVEQPMETVREHGLAPGEAEFGRLRETAQARFGINSVEVADLLTAFGVELYKEWSATDDRALLQASRGYLQSAISGYRAAFGPDHPEVAVALHSFADVDIELHGGRSPAAEAALGEALRIRRAALGPRNHETRATEMRLASLGNLEVGDWNTANAASRALEQADHARDRQP